MWPLLALDRSLCIYEGPGQSEPILGKYHADPRESRSSSKRNFLWLALVLWPFSFPTVCPSSSNKHALTDPFCNLNLPSAFFRTSWWAPYSRMCNLCPLDITKLYLNRINFSGLIIQNFEMWIKFDFYLNHSHMLIQPPPLMISTILCLYCQHLQQQVDYH